MVIERASLERARDGFGKHAWTEAHAAFRAADAEAALAPADLEDYAWAAWWSARPTDSITLRERAYSAYVAANDLRGAGRVALDLGRENAMRNALTVATAWFQRAVRALEGEPRWREHAQLAVAKSMMVQHDPQEQLAAADTALELAARFQDRDALAQALMLRGTALIASGRVKEGLPLVDEATVAAVSGELGLFTTGWIYCNTISTCRDLGDLRRAGEWTEAAHRWCERQSVSGFPGVCRVHRAEIIALQGSLARAEQEARQATDELGRYSILNMVPDGWYEIGDIRLRMGDLSAAEEAFGQAHEMGRSPEPGLSLVRLAQGKAAAANASLRRALAEERSRPRRARLLPAYVEIAIAAGDVASARSGADELAEIAAVLEGPTLAAASATARARVRFAEGDVAVATNELRRALELWQRLEMPFEASSVRVALATALRAAGDEDGARLELQSARSTFERIGAVREARRAASLLGDAAVAAASGPRVRKTFLFSDIVNSTSLVAAIGDEAWQHLIRWHDDTLRSIVAEHGGEEIRHQGDGLVVSFDDAARALSCAVAIQRRLADQRRAQGFAPQVRIGVHTTDATKRGLDYAGIGVHEAARIGALAGAGEIVASEDTLGAQQSELALGDARSVQLKGIPEPVRVRTVLWR